MGWFDKAFKKLIKDEGLYSNIKLDKGGRTIYGITEKNYPEIFNKIYKLYKTNKQELGFDLAKRFYQENYWNVLYDESDYNLVEKIFSLSVNIGKIKAIKILQITLNIYYKANLYMDGIFGQKTLKELKQHYQPGIRAAYIYRLLQYHELIVKNNPSQKKFEIGWFIRDVS